MHAAPRVLFVGASLLANTLRSGGSFASKLAPTRSRASRNPGVGWVERSDTHRHDRMGFANSTHPTDLAIVFRQGGTAEGATVLHAAPKVLFVGASLLANRLRSGGSFASKLAPTKSRASRSPGVRWVERSDTHRHDRMGFANSTHPTDLRHFRERRAYNRSRLYAVGPSTGAKDSNPSYGAQARCRPIRLTQDFLFTPDGPLSRLRGRVREGETWRQEKHHASDQAPLPLPNPLPEGRGGCPEWPGGWASSWHPDAHPRSGSVRTPHWPARRTSAAGRRRCRRCCRWSG
ncbi:hypothetical protein J2T41_002878 [Pseudomonas citronellolis]|nr:hypothetical protein [Pseudomonas citronellolis]MCP1666182.1 hypothetical protein [Pseudomonas citronellolis]MCP1698087.1 hypothetical protein [Pseudomonas citronellolis]MCP1703929.1 hypothetical protein [Pseudomonas citronellolis]MCP1797721.1 hypothetical protein [Pseudomonas citronellolis]